jgi:hypothetical protein
MFIDCENDYKKAIKLFRAITLDKKLKRDISRINRHKEMEEKLISQTDNILEIKKPITNQIAPESAALPSALPLPAQATTSPESLAPESLAPVSLAPESLAPESLAPESLAPVSLAPVSLAPESLAPESLAPESLAPEEPSVKDIPKESVIINEILNKNKLSTKQEDINQQSEPNNLGIIFNNPSIPN